MVEDFCMICGKRFSGTNPDKVKLERQKHEKSEHAGTQVPEEEPATVMFNRVGSIART